MIALWVLNLFNTSASQLPRPANWEHLLPNWEEHVLSVELYVPQSILVPFCFPSSTKTNFCNKQAILLTRLLSPSMKSSLPELRQVLWKLPRTPPIQAATCFRRYHLADGTEQFHNKTACRYSFIPCAINLIISKRSLCVCNKPPHFCPILPSKQPSGFYFSLLCLSSRALSLQPP